MEGADAYEAPTQAADQSCEDTCDAADGDSDTRKLSAITVGELKATLRTVFRDPPPAPLGGLTEGESYPLSEPPALPARRSLPKKGNKH